MNFWQRLKNPKRSCTLQTARTSGRAWGSLSEYLPPNRGEYRLYRELREAVPLIDAAVAQIVRLTISFTVECDHPASQRELERFAQQVNATGGMGLSSFACAYLDSMLTFGNGVGEMVPGPEGTGIAALYNAPPENLWLVAGEDGITPEFRTWQTGGWQPVERPQWIVNTALNPRPGELTGRSLLEGLPLIGEILMKIFRSVGNNFDRVGDLRYAVTYKPGNDPMDRAYAGEIAQNLAKEWASAMEDSAVRDFVAVGDVDVKVIGADSQMLETQVPVRQLLEQVVAKVGVPPFLLGLHWSTTERMAAQQVDLFTTGLDYYRSLLEPVLKQICRTHLRLLGLSGEPRIRWENIGLQDELELANARLLTLQAEQLEKEMEESA